CSYVLSGLNRHVWMAAEPHNAHHPSSCPSPNGRRDALTTAAPLPWGECWGEGSCAMAMPQHRKLPKGRISQPDGSGLRPAQRKARLLEFDPAAHGADIVWQHAAITARFQRSFHQASVENAIVVFVMEHENRVIAGWQRFKRVGNLKILQAFQHPPANGGVWKIARQVARPLVAILYHRRIGEFRA